MTKELTKALPPLLKRGPIDHLIKLGPGAKHPDKGPTLTNGTY